MPRSKVTTDGGFKVNQAWGINQGQKLPWMNPLGSAWVRTAIQAHLGSTIQGEYSGGAGTSHWDKCCHKAVRRMKIFTWWLSYPCDWSGTRGTTQFLSYKCLLVWYHSRNATIPRRYINHLEVILYKYNCKLKSFMSTKHLTQRQAWWEETLGCFDF